MPETLPEIRRNGCISRQRREDYVFINAVREVLGKAPLPRSQTEECQRARRAREDLRFVDFWLSRPQFD